MPDPAPNPDLLRSLGKLVRGLSALFWGLPIALIACVWIAYSQWLKAAGWIPPIISTALLLYGLWQLAGFQKQERVWRRAIDAASVLDRKSTRLNSSHLVISYAVFCLKKKTKTRCLDASTN